MKDFACCNLLANNLRFFFTFLLNLFFIFYLDCFEKLKGYPLHGIKSKVK